jgi:hypothetical protein
LLLFATHVIDKKREAKRVLPKFVFKSEQNTLNPSELTNTNDLFVFATDGVAKDDRRQEGQVSKTAHGVVHTGKNSN